MSSTRNGLVRIWAAGWIAAALLAGCQMQQHVPPPEALNNTPIKTDQAMAHRNWSPSPAYYQNDAVFTWPDYAPLQPKPLPYSLNSLTEPVLFLANTFYFPVGVFLEPAWRQQMFKSLSAPPSYTLMPPLPNGPEPTP